MVESMKKWKYLSLAIVIAITVSILFTSVYASLLQPAQAAPTKAGTTLSVTKTADTRFIRLTEWSIGKTVTPTSIDLFRGDSVVAQYQITATKTVTDIYRVSGQICVKNGGSVATQNLVIVDNVQYKTGSGKYQNVPGATQTITPSVQILAGQTVCYSYSISFTPIANASYRNAVDVTITNHSGYPGTPYGPSYRTEITFPKTPELQGNNSINVSDAVGGNFPFSASGTASYTHTYNCDADDGPNFNTATITGTSVTASVSITLNCYSLQVTKDVTSASLVREWKWAVDKTAEVTLLGTNIHYVVTLTGTPTIGYQATGGINVHNPAPISATINSLNDIVPEAITTTVDCGSATFPYNLASLGDLNCTYLVSLPNTNSRINTATATLQNYAYDNSGTPTATGTTDFSGTATINFGATPSTTELDECATVQDVNSFDQTYNIPQYCAIGTTKNTVFTEYDLPISGACTGVDISNTATFTTNDSGATASASAHVTNAAGTGIGVCEPIREPSNPPEVPWRELHNPPD